MRNPKFTVNLLRLKSVIRRKKVGDKDIKIKKIQTWIIPVRLRMACPIGWKRSICLKTSATLGSSRSTRRKAVMFTLLYLKSSRSNVSISWNNDDTNWKHSKVLTLSIITWHRIVCIYFCPTLVRKKNFSFRWCTHYQTSFSEWIDLKLVQQLSNYVCDEGSRCPFSHYILFYQFSRRKRPLRWKNTKHENKLNNARPV